MVALAALLGLGHAGTSAHAASTALVGNAAVEANADSNGAGTAEAFQATAAGTGTATDVFVYLDSSVPTRIVAGLYADSAGHPGALLAQGTLATPKVSAWNDVPLTSGAGLSTGTKYWIAVLSPSGAGTVRFRDRKASGASESSLATTLASLPTAWSTGHSYTDAFLSAYAVAGAADTSPPAQPQSFAETARTGTSVSTSWTASSDNVGVAGYDVYVGTPKVSTTGSTAYTFAGLSCGQAVSLGVVSFDAAGNRSTEAALTTSTSSCPDATPPTAPTSLLVTSTTSASISTMWSPSTDNVGVAGYDLYVGAQQVGTTAGTAYLFGGLACGQIVTLGADAYDVAGNRSPLVSITATTSPCADQSPPTTPAGFGVTGSTINSIQTGWSAATDDVGVAGYNLYLGSLKVGSSAALSYTFSSLTCGTAYTLGLETYDAAGNVSPRTLLLASTVACPDATPPSQPGSFAETSSDGTSASTSWTAATDNVGVAGYTLYLNGLQAGTTQATSYVFWTLACGTTYPAGLEADDAAGNVSSRATLLVTTAPCPDLASPSSPTGFLVTASSASSISTAWSASSDNVGVAGYKVFLDGSLVTTVTGTSFAFTGLGCGTLHTLGVAAYDAAGNVSSTTSQNASTGACPDVTPPTVAVSAPATGASVSGAAVALSAAASDGVGVTSVRFAVDGTLVGLAITAAPYTWTWDSRTVSSGSHQIAAVATDAAGNSATSASLPVSVSNGFDTSNALKTVAVGPGFVDASTRDVVRTSGDRVYLFVADDTAERQATGPGVIHAYKAGQSGIPTTFSEADGIHRPSATGSTHVLGSPDARLDRSGIARLVYINDSNLAVVYQTFSTLTDSWGPTEVIGSNGAPITSGIKREGNVALALDQNDIPQVVYSTGTSLIYRNRAGGTWSAPVTVASGGAPIHPQLAYDSAGTLHLAWLQDGTAPSIHYKSLPAGGSWGADEAVATTDVLGNSNSDQGPSIVVTSSGVPYVQYVSASKIFTNGANYGAIRIRYRTTAGWVLDATPTDLLTHTPQIYAQNNDIYAFLGHDTNIFFGYSWQGAGGSWSPYTVLFNGTTVDGSANVRWDPQRETNPNVIDVAFFDEDLNNNKSYLSRAYYIAVLPRGAQPSQTPPPPDTTAPTVSVTAPAAGTTVSGSVTVTASASDNVGVAGVQFTLDGNPLGAEVAAAPYSITWNAATATAGAHVLAAVARDAAGNRTTSASVTVTVDNTIPADTTAPTVSVTAPAAGTTVSGSVSVNANASDNVGVAGVQFTLDGAALGAEDTSAPYSVSWNTTTAAAGTHVLGATARDAAGNRTSAVTVSVTASNSAPALLVGDQAVEISADSDSAGHAEAFSFVAAASGSLSSLHVYIDAASPATRISVGVYSANGAHPGTLLTQGAITAPTSAGWNAVSVPVVTVTAGTTYWLAVLSSGTGAVRFRDRSTGGASETSAQTTLASLPAAWTTGAAFRNAPISFYGG